MDIETNDEYLTIEQEQDDFRFPSDDEIRDKVGALLEKEDPEPVDEQPQPEAEPEFDITYRGETKKLKKSELIDLAQKGFDYTTKTQSLGEERRRHSDQVAAFQRQQALHEAHFKESAKLMLVEDQLGRIDSQDLHSLKASDPTRYHEALLQRSELYERKLQLSKELEEIERAQRHERERQHAANLHRLNSIPGWSDETKNKVTEFLRTQDFGDEELSHMLNDPRFVALAHKAYSATVARDTLKDKRVPSSKVAKPGPSSFIGKSSNQQETLKLRKQAKKSGRIDDAVKYLERVI